MMELLIIGFILLLVAFGWYLVTGRKDTSPVIDTLVMLHMICYVTAGVHFAYLFILESHSELEWWQAANLNFGVFVLVGVVAAFMVYFTGKQEGKQ